MENGRRRSFVPLHVNWLNSLAPAPTDPTFRDMLFSLCSVPIKWEVSRLLEHAARQVELDSIYGAAEEESEFMISLAQSMGANTKPDWGYKDCVIRALLRYFHSSLFTSVDNPACEFCRSSFPAVFRGNIPPTEEEKVGAVDVTKRYVRRSSHALLRERCSEEQLLRTINGIKKMRRMDMSQEDLLRLRREDSAEVKELESYNAWSRVMVLEDHRPTSTEVNPVQRKSGSRAPGSKTPRLRTPGSRKLRTDSASTSFILIKEKES